jgi:aminopeptidase N
MARLLTLTAAVQEGAPLALDATFIEAQRALLADSTLDAAFRELALILPSETIVADRLAVVDPQAIHIARQFMRRTLGSALKAEWLAAYHANQTPGAYSPDALSAGKRGLKNLALSYLLIAADADALALARSQFDTAGNMTDRSAALNALIHSDASNADANAAAEPLQHFYADFEAEALVIDKWFSMQAAAPATDVAAVRALMTHPAFTLKNPNRARSLIFSFCNGNPSQFHTADGSAYDFWAEQVIALNALNPQVAARLARSMDRWRRFVPALQVHMKAALEKVARSKNLSNDVQEVVGKALAN